jgi:hypothetical protein
MAQLDYTAEANGPLLLELPVEAEQLHLEPGDKVHIRLDQATESTDLPTRNEGMIAALREIAKRQKGRRHTDASDTNRMLREGRAGAMWGCDPSG